MTTIFARCYSVASRPASSQQPASKQVTTVQSIYYTVCTICTIGRFPIHSFGEKIADFSFTVMECTVYVNASYRTVSYRIPILVFSPLSIRVVFVYLVNQYDRLPYHTSQIVIHVTTKHSHNLTLHPFLPNVL